MAVVQTDLLQELALHQGAHACDLFFYSLGLPRFKGVSSKAGGIAVSVTSPLP